MMLAMGFLGPEETVIQQLGLEQGHSNIKLSMVNSRPVLRVFLLQGTVAVGGQSLVVWAINEGRSAARECDGWLMNGGNEFAVV